MATNDKISLKHGYTLHFNENDTLFLKVETEEDTLEFYGKNGNLIIASSFEEFEEYRDTLDNILETTMEFFSDWGVDEDTATAICDELTPWFGKYAMSEEEKAEETIAKLERIIAWRRGDIEQRMHSIDAEVEIISKANKEITYHTERVLELNKDIEKYQQTIATIKASLNKSRFISVEPCYTGGGIYLFTGHLTDGNYFMADTSFYDVRVLTEDPNEPTYIRDDGTVWERNIDSVEWQEEHLVKDLTPAEAVAFFKEMLKWVKENEPSGNYNESDMDDIREEVESLHGDWR